MSREKPVDEKHPHLSAEDIAAIKAEALKQHEESLKNSARRALLEAEKRRLQRVSDPNEEVIENVYIDLPPFADRLVIDGVAFLHGGTYAFSKRQYQSVIDNVARAWAHQDEVEGHRRDYRKPRGLVLEGGDAYRRRGI